MPGYQSYINITQFHYVTMLLITGLHQLHNQRYLKKLQRLRVLVIVAREAQLHANLS